MKCGGTSDVKDADEEIKAFTAQLKNDFETKAGKTFSQFTAIRYTSQVVAGTNYFVKIQVGETEYIHARLFKPLPHTGDKVELVKYQENKNLEDTIEYF